MIENKRILMVGKETFTYPFYFLSRAWKEKNTLAMLWTNPIESEYDECDINRSTYYAFEKLGFVKNYTLNEIADVYTEELKSPNVDYQDLKRIEEKYTHFKNLNCQLISDQKMTGHYHFRTMCVPVTYEQQLRWIQLMYQAIEKILDDFKPDVIFDCDIAELCRTVLNEVAYSRGIPYISIAYPKYEMYKIPSFSLSTQIDPYLRDEYAKCLELDNIEEKEYIEKFRVNQSIKNKMYIGVNNLTYQYTADSLLNTIKTIYYRGTYFLKQDLSSHNRELKKKNPVLYDRSSKYMKFWVRTQLYRRKLMKSKSFFDKPVEGEPYVYMPLHLIPESTTFSIAPFWINELSAIEAVSKALPAGWYLYVKEHQAMLGERGEEFYRKVKKIPNVKLVQFNYYTDPKPWIENARAVVAITGTAAYEAVLLGKPGFVFGDVPFELIKGITKISCINNLPSMLRDLDEIDNIRECAAYIRAVKNTGVSINLNYIMNEAYNALFLNKPLENKFHEEIENLRLFFEKALSIYEEYHYSQK